MKRVCCVMKLRRGTLVLAAMLLGGVMASGQVAARGGHGGGHSGGHMGSSGSHAGSSGSHSGHFSGSGRFVPRFHAGVFIGAAPFAPFYLYPPLSPDYYYGAPPAGTPFWYFCASANTYYPYVADCPEGWQQVVPEPPS
jgi:hypothetical protein